MQKLLTFIFTLLTTTLALAQSFEGKIIYASTYVNKTTQTIDMEMTMLLGTTQAYIIKGGNYKSIPNGALVEWQLYNNSENKIYNKLSSNDAAFWMDCSEQGDKVLKTEVNKNVLEVLGYPCDEVILTCESGMQKYYFNAALGVDASLFENHKLGNWYDFISVANALPLKSIIVQDQVLMESTATEIRPMMLDNQLFQLPAGMRTEKSPY